MAVRLAQWKSEEGRAEYLAAYDKAMSLWPVGFESQVIPTRFGDTHAVVSGPSEAPPLLLLPAAIGIGAIQWYHNAKTLSSNRRIYAVDFVGAPGKGSQSDAMLDGADCATWIVDLLDALDIKRADIAASSQGGWLALNFVIAAPSQAGSTALLAPAASLRPFRRPVELAIRAGPYMPAWTAGPTINAAFAGEYRADERLVRVAELALRHFRYQKRAVIPGEFSDDGLTGVDSRVLVMIGDGERIYDPHDALARARTLIPWVETDLVADAGHLLNMERAAYVDQRLSEFFGTPAAAGG